jgi:hypothetical protein
MATTLDAGDPRIDSLDEGQAAALRRIIAAPDFAARTALLAPLMASIGLAPVAPGASLALRPIVDPARFDASTRTLLVLLAELGLGLHKYPVYSNAGWLREWLGLDPPGALFRVVDDEGTPRTRLEAIRRRQATGEIDAYVRAIPTGERVEILAALLRAGQDLRVSNARALLHEALRLLDAGAGEWARAAIERLSPEDRVTRETLELERAVFMALARANVPIEPRWDPLVPISYGTATRWIMEECLGAVSPERRAAAVLARLARCDPGFEYPLLAALEVLELVPDVSIARWVYERRDEHSKPSEIVDRLRGLGATHADILALVSSPEPAPALVPVEQTLDAPALDDVARRQLEIASERYDGGARTAASILAGEGDEAITPASIRRFALLRDGNPAYDAWLYMGDAGVVFRGCSTDAIADIVQGGVECSDAKLRGELRSAIAVARDLPRAAPATRRAKVRGSAKNTRGAKKKPRK